MPNKNPETSSVFPRIMEAANPYHEEYRYEVERGEWSELDIVHKMNFAKVYGFLTPRQAAAFDAAVECNNNEEDPLPPVGVGFLAEGYFEDNTFRPDLTKE